MKNEIISSLDYTCALLVGEGYKAWEYLFDHIRKKKNIKNLTRFVCRECEGIFFSSERWNKMFKRLRAEVEFLKLVKENDAFRDNLKHYLEAFFMKSRHMCWGNIYKIYYDVSNSSFRCCEFTNWNEDVISDDLITITTMTRAAWDDLEDEYNMQKEYLEAIGDEMAYTFDEWVEEIGAKEEYIENCMESIIDGFEESVRYEKERYAYIERFKKTC